jgi:membrane protease subunit HflK
VFRFRTILALVVIAYLLTGVTQVSPEERVVVRRFGKVVARPGPGLWVGLPWGVDRVDRVPVRTALQLTVGYDPQTASDARGTPTGQFLTGDQNLVNVQLVLDYAIGETDADLDDFVNHRDAVDVTLSRITEAAAAEWVAGRGVDRVLITGNAALPAWVAARVSERLPEYHLGVRLQRVSVGYLAPPEEVRAAFEAVTQAQAGIRTREFQALQEKELRERQSDALRYKLGQEAEESRESQLRQARAEAAAFLDELAAHREVAKTNPDALAVVWWAEMGKAMESLEARGGRVRPLDQHLQNGELNLTEFVPLRDLKR